MKVDHDAVAALLREAADVHILPFWKALEPGQMEEKSPGELVTLADRSCEAFLAERLPGLLPGSLVVGEEMATADPGCLQALTTDRPVWVIDPLDGTRNFASHSGPFAVMACLVSNNTTVAAWVLDPMAKRLMAAETGGGAWIDDRRVTAVQRNADLSALRGALMTRFLPPGMREHVVSKRELFAESQGSHCAGHDYYRLVSGELDFLFYYRTLVWDHAPGTLIAEEAGCQVSRYDGSCYRPASQEAGLICTTNRELSDRLRDELLTGVLSEPTGEQEP